MLVVRRSTEGVLENSFFRVGKHPGVSARLIWSGNNANLAFRLKASAVTLSSSGLFATWSFEESNPLSSSDVPHSITTTACAFRKIMYVSSDSHGYTRALFPAAIHAED